MSFCTITADRGDRPQLLDFCKHQIDRMTVKPDKSYFIDYKPKNGEIDLIPRIQEGIRQAKADGIEWAFILENDDFYDPHYFEGLVLSNADFYGENHSIYYNLRNRTWQDIRHPARASLYTTGFRIAALDGFNWPKSTERFLDIALWNHAQRKKIRWRSTKAIGIKTGLGLCGGKGHVMTMPNKDPNLDWLKANTDQESYIFYQTLKL